MYNATKLHTIEDVVFYNKICAQQLLVRCTFVIQDKYFLIHHPTKSNKKEKENPNNQMKYIVNNNLHECGWKEEGSLIF